MLFYVFLAAAFLVGVGNYHFVKRINQMRLKEEGITAEREHPTYLPTFALLFAFVCSIDMLMRQRLFPGESSSSSILETIRWIFWFAISLICGTYVASRLDRRSNRE